jgi:ubiquitin-conjugating enzyme E2 variant
VPVLNQAGLAGIAPGEPALPPAPPHAEPPPASRTHRIMEIGSVVVASALLLWMAVRVARGIDTIGHAFGVLTAVLIGYLLADLSSGIVHWMGDTLGDEKAGWFGPAFSQPFREHHVDPRAISHHGFIETNGNTCIVALPPLIAAHAWMPAHAGVLFYLAAFVASLALFGIATNQCHKWAHSERVPRGIAWLQRCRLIIDPDRHNRHHVPPHRDNYCVLSGWMNGFADRLRLFRAVEHLIRRTRPGWLNEEAARRG